MDKNPAPLRMPQMLVWPHYQNRGGGHPKWCRIVVHQSYFNGVLFDFGRHCFLDRQHQDFLDGQLDGNLLDSCN